MKRGQVPIVYTLNKVYVTLMLRFLQKGLNSLLGERTGVGGMLVRRRGGEGVGFGIELDASPFSFSVLFISVEIPWFITESSRYTLLVDLERF